MDIDGIPRRIAYWRDRRGLTQADLAFRLGGSKSWVQKLESGDRQADPRISVLERVAAALSIPLEVLLGAEMPRRECVDAAEIAIIRDTLLRPDVITGIHTDAEPVDLRSLERRADYCFEAYQAAHYSTLGRVLPDLILDGQRAAQSNDQAALAALSSIYHVTALVLMKFSDATLAWHAADRALTTAHRSSDAASIGLAAQMFTYAMFGHGQAKAGADLSINTAETFAAELQALGPPGWAVYGSMFLKAAVAVAATENIRTTRDLIAEAKEAAGHTGDNRNDFHTCFGITNCLLHEASVLGQFGEYSAAIETANRIAPNALAALSRERRTHHFIDTAVAHHGLHQDDQALSYLLDAERHAPQEVHCRPATRLLISDMLHQAKGSGSWALQGLAKRSGVVR
ncbi:helix-turn-helix transcriptional regulator [Nocardia vinacea]|uniref:helix-turn-helix domain-containing protein n=1 Tax=Nocardia vinacea TaxID=96468 RepID=UPI002E0F4441|nr:helix-turn-helix transcriptional regulator [Nocardia vinacea]